MQLQSVIIFIINIYSACFWLIVDIVSSINPNVSRPITGDPNKLKGALGTGNLYSQQITNVC